MALDVDDDVGRAFVAAVENAIEEVLDFAEVVAVVADDAGGVARADVEHGAAGLVAFLDFENEAEMAQ